MYMVTHIIRITVWFRRWYFPSLGTNSCICSRLFSILGVWFWLGLLRLGLQLRLELVLKVSWLGLGLGLVLVGIDVVCGLKIAPVVYICQTRMESNAKRLVLGFRVFYSVLLQTNSSEQHYGYENRYNDTDLSHFFLQSWTTACASSFQSSTWNSDIFRIQKKTTEGRALLTFNLDWNSCHQI